MRCVREGFMAGCMSLFNTLLKHQTLPDCSLKCNCSNKLVASPFHSLSWTWNEVVTCTVAKTMIKEVDKQMCIQFCKEHIMMETYYDENKLWRSCSDPCLRFWEVLWSSPSISGKQSATSHMISHQMLNFVISGTTISMFLNGPFLLYRKYHVASGKGIFDWLI